MVQDKGKLVHAHPANELTEKLFGFESVIAKIKTADADATIFSLNSDDVPTGKIWKITYVMAWNEDGATTTRIRLWIDHNGTIIYFHLKEGTTATRISVEKSLELFLDADDFVVAKFDGLTVGNTCYLSIFGYEMNAP